MSEETCKNCGELVSAHYGDVDLYLVYCTEALRRQLGEANRNCDVAMEGMQKAVRVKGEAEAQAAEMRELLQRLQWSDDGVMCPECGELRSDGHAPGCELVAALSSDAGRELLERVRLLERAVRLAAPVVLDGADNEALLQAQDAIRDVIDRKGA